MYLFNIIQPSINELLTSVDLKIIYNKSDAHFFTITNNTTYEEYLRRRYGSTQSTAVTKMATNNPSSTAYIGMYAVLVDY